MKYPVEPEYENGKVARLVVPIDGGDVTVLNLHKNGEFVADNLNLDFPIHKLETKEMYVDTLVDGEKAFYTKKDTNFSLSRVLAVFICFSLVSIFIAPIVLILMLVMYRRQDEYERLFYASTRSPFDTVVESEYLDDETKLAGVKAGQRIQQGEKYIHNDTVYEVDDVDMSVMQATVTQISSSSP